jgi:hypothetical protein
MRHFLTRAALSQQERWVVESSRPKPSELEPNFFATLNFVTTSLLLLSEERNYPVNRFSQHVNVD